MRQTGFEMQLTEAPKVVDGRLHDFIPVLDRVWEGEIRPGSVTFDLHCNEVV